MKRAGGAVPSAKRITLPRDCNGDGIAETRAEFPTRLNSPIGIALVDNVIWRVTPACEVRERNDIRDFEAPRALPKCAYPR